MDFEAFRDDAKRVSDWMADYLAGIEERPVRAQTRPGEIYDQLPAACPETGEAFEAMFRDFQDIVLPGMTHWQHPKFFAYFNANSSPPSVLAEMLVTAMAAQCMLWETSPAATEMEKRMMEWLQALLGLPDEWAGTIQDTASAATLCAILAGLDHASDGKASREGLASLGGAPTVYCAAEAHSSIEKGARIAGVGSACVRQIPGLDPAALEAAIAEDRAAGRLPACIIGSFGATGLGAVDPLRAIGEIARRENIHFHVDGAWAGSALILPEVRPMADGIELADSFVFNPHKWLFVNFDCSAFYMRDPERLTRALSLTPAYLQSDDAAAMPEYRDWGVALGRRFRALKLWFVMRSFGAEGLRAKLRDHVEWTRRLAELIEATPGFEIASPPMLGLLAFRFTGPDGRAGDRENQALLDRINASGELYLTKTVADGRIVIRWVVGQTYTRWRHVEEGWASTVRMAQELSAG